MQVKNGRWVNNQGESLSTPQEHIEFQDTLSRVKLFSRGRRLTTNKVSLLFNILNTKNEVDDALTSVLSMDINQIKRLF
jgi:hypothetical protein